MTGRLAEMIEATSIEDVWEIYLSEMARFGFSRVIYAFTRFHIQGALTDVDDALILSNHEKRYLDVFIGQELFKSAPMVRWAAENVGTSSWRVTQERYARGELSAEARRVHEFNQRMGVAAGYSVGFKDVSTRSKGALGLVGAPGLTQDDVDQIWDEHSREILVLSNLMHLKVSNLPRLAPDALTQRQREALEWVADGKTTQDIAILMGISVAMVEKHLRLARGALNVETTAHAVAKASLMNQIFVVPGHETAAVRKT